MILTALLDFPNIFSRRQSITPSILMIPPKAAANMSIVIIEAIEHGCQRAHEKCDDEKYLRIYGFQPRVNQCGNRPAHDPSGDEASYEEQDQYGRCYGRYGVDNGFLYGIIGNSPADGHDSRKNRFYEKQYRV